MESFFIYCRKSSEAEDRQVLSIQSQTTELEALARRMNGRVICVFSEAQSAKEPGRPVFAEMMRRLGRGEAAGILCWKLDRLARNPIDGGAIIWAVNKHGTKIVTPNQSFLKGDESLLLMYLELATAHKYVIDLARNVSRGLKTKAIELGWKPGLARIGYIHVRKDDGSKIIADDPTRHAAVRKLWDLLLTGQYSVRAILNVAKNDLGLQTKATRRRPAKPFSLSGLYSMFSSRFYCGEFEYPQGSGNWYVGSHKPMITKAEFDRAQRILGRSDRPRPQKHDFAFVGLMRCGECGRMITAEEKYKRQANGNIHHYIYYHCTTGRRPRCNQGSIEEKALVGQILRFLGTIEVPLCFIDWTLRHIRQLAEAEHHDEVALAGRRRKQSAEIDASLHELTRMRMTRLVDDDEFQRERNLLLQEKSQLTSDCADPESSSWREELEFIFSSVFSIERRFLEADPSGMRAILAEIGSNLVLKDKKLNVEAKEPFRIIQQAIGDIVGNWKAIEPLKNGSIPTDSPYFQNAFRIMCTSVNDVRTCLRRIRLEEEEKKLREMGVPPEKRDAEPGEFGKAA